MKKNVVCFGEVLWDVLPTGKIAGGAPMNVAIRLQSMGIHASVISRIGNDAAGAELIQIIQQKKVAVNLIQQDNNIATGEVHVKLDEKGIATYDIVYPSAWDSINLTTDNFEAVKNATAFVYGSLACRDEVSLNTLLQLLSVASYKILDVNLRPPFYSIPFIEMLMKQSDFIKLNDDELRIVAESLGSATTDIEENILFIANRTDTKTICVTRGKDGAILYAENKFWSHPGFTVKVDDTIGSGDSFLAALISKIIYNNNYSEAIEFACAIGAIVATHKGANPDITEDEMWKLMGK